MKVLNYLVLNTSRRGVVVQDLLLSFGSLCMLLLVSSSERRGIIE